jgi:hypothetical protein
MPALGSRTTCGRVPARSPMVGIAGEDAVESNSGV